MKVRNKDHCVMDKVIAHFSSKDNKIIEVPEWGSNEAPLLIYASPITLMEKNRLYKISRDDDLSFMVEVLIMKAQNAKGGNIFTIADKQVLMRSADPDIIIRVANQIMDVDPLDEAKKNF